MQFAYMQSLQCVTVCKLGLLCLDKVSEHCKLRGGVIFVDFIPKTANGKHLRREMKKQMLAKQLKNQILEEESF